MDGDLFIKNAQVVLEDAVFHGGVVIAEGKIAAIVSDGLQVSAPQVIDAGGKHLLPGVIDAHVHFNQPGRDHWEGYLTGSMAAAAGGVTTVLEMPLNATPPTIDEENLVRKQASVVNDSVVDYGLFGGLVDDNLAELEALHAGGGIGFKAFMSNSGVDFARINDDLLFAGLEKIGQLGNVLAVHAENEFVTGYLSGKMQAAGRTDRASWYEARPPEQEVEAIRRACYWADVTNGALHVVHVSVPEGLREIDRANAAGVKVTSETCPHFLFFDHQDYERLGPVAKCAPPIRSRAVVEELWECVFAGLVDVIASDHSPCTWDEKAPGLENIWKAWGGISGIQTMLPAMLSEGVNKRGLALTQLMQMLAANPARIYGLYPQKGAILVGADADLVLVDLAQEWELAADHLFYKNKHSPYVGYSFKGSVERTWVRGQTVYASGQITARPGSGCLLKRT